MAHRPVQWPCSAGEHPGDNDIKILETAGKQTIVIKLDDMGAKLASPVMRLVDTAIDPANGQPLQPCRVHQRDIGYRCRAARLRPYMRIGKALRCEHLVFTDACPDPVMTLPCRRGNLQPP